MFVIDNQRAAAKTGSAKPPSESANLLVSKKVLMFDRVIACKHPDIGLGKQQRIEFRDGSVGKLTLAKD